MILILFSQWKYNCISFVNFNFLLSLWDLYHEWFCIFFSFCMVWWTNFHYYEVAFRLCKKYYQILGTLLLWYLTTILHTYNSYPCKHSMFQLLNIPRSWLFVVYSLAVPSLSDYWEHKKSKIDYYSQKSISDML